MATEYRILSVGRHRSGGPIEFVLQVGNRPNVEMITIDDQKAFDFAFDILRALRPKQQAQEADHD